MSLERDIQHNKPVLDVEGVTVSAKDTPVLSATVIDTQGMRGILIAVDPSRELGAVATEAFRFYAMDSPDGVTYTQVAETKILPTRNYDADGQLIINPVAPFLQTFGIISCERYLQIGVQATAYNQSEASFALGVMFESERAEFVGYEATPDAPHVDTQP